MIMPQYFGIFVTRCSDEGQGRRGRNRGGNEDGEDKEDEERPPVPEQNNISTR